MGDQNEGIVGWIPTEDKEIVLYLAWSTFSSAQGPRSVEVNEFTKSIL